MDRVWILITISVLVLTSFGQKDFQVNVPPQCQINPSVLTKFCCFLPPFFTSQIFVGCGGYGRKPNLTDISFKSYPNTTVAIRVHELECTFWRCLAIAYSFVKITIPELQFIDLNKYFKHLDAWTALNPTFTSVIHEAKLTCKNALRIYLPLNVCEFPGFNHCIRQYLKVKCPTTFPTPECEEQTEYYKRCGQYYLPA